MSKNNKELVVLKDWANEYGCFIARESQKLLEACGRSQGEAGLKLLTIEFFSHFVEHMVLSSLKEFSDKGLTNKVAYDKTSRNFMALKSVIQSSIAEGFEQAFFKFTGKQAEYYCQISLVPEAVNKRPI